MSDRSGRNGRHGRHGRNGRHEKPDLVPDFEIVLWGYHREQVERCLEDMTARLEEALCRLDGVELLQAQLCEAQIEVDLLRRAAEERPSVANRLAALLKSAEELREHARRDAEAIRSGARIAARNGSGRGPVVTSAE